MRKRQPSKDRAGSAIVVSIVAVSVMGLLTVSLLQLTTTTSSESDAVIAENEATCLAESAFHEAATSLLAGGSGSLGERGAPLLFGQGLVWTSAEEIAEDTYRVTCTGMAHSGRRTLEGIVRHGNTGNVGFSLFSDKKLDLKKEVFFDSYDSAEGTYASQAVHETDGVVHADREGDVLSNEDIRIDKEIQIFGDVKYGPGHELKHKGDGKESIVSGHITELGIRHEYPPVTPPADTPPSLGDVHLHGDPTSDEPDLVLGPGMVHYDKMKIHKDAKVKIIGPATVVVDEKFELDSTMIVDGTNGQVALYVGEKLAFKKKNNIQVLSGSAQDLIVLVGSKIDKKGKVKKTKAKVEGSFTGILYAPHSKVDFKKEVEFFGAVIAHSVKLHKGSRFHYDKALERMDSVHVGEPGMVVVSLYPVELDTDLGRAHRGDPFAALGVEREQCARLSKSWEPNGGGSGAAGEGGETGEGGEDEEHWEEDDFPWVDEDWWPDEEDEEDDDV